MSKRIVFMGTGAVGGYIGGHIARIGEDVTLIDPWPEHIEYIKHNGIHLSGMQGEHTEGGRLYCQHYRCASEKCGEAIVQEDPHPYPLPEGEGEGEDA